MQQLLHHVPAFAELDETTRQQVATCFQARTLTAGESLFISGQAYCEQIFLLQSGDLRLHQEQHTLRLTSGEFVGLLNALDGSPYASSAVAHSDVQLWSIHAPRLQAIEAVCPTLFHALRRFIAKQIHAWHVPLTTPSFALPARAVMKTPLVTCSESDTLVDAYQLMNTRQIGSIGVLDTQGRLRGLLTYQQLAEATLCQKMAANTPLHQLNLRIPLFVRPDVPVWQVEETQAEYRCKYVVVGEPQHPLGMISQTDLLRYVFTQQGIALAAIAQARNIAELKTFQATLPHFARDAWEYNRRASTAVRMISEYHLAVQRRCIELTLAELIAQGQAVPPVRYAFIIMGSGGRKEMLLNPDQDNGLILEDTPALTDEARRWFQTYAKQVNRCLDEVGYPLCTGDIMARNPLFHKTLSEWKQQLSHILAQPTAKAARWANIFLDFDTLYGDDTLVSELTAWFDNELRKKPRLLRLMVEDDAQGRAALGFFNRLIMTQKDESGRDRLDIKRNGLRIIADAARIFAWSRNIEPRNTNDRLEALVRYGVFDDNFARFVYGAFDKLLDLLLRHQFHQLEKNEPLTKLIDPALFSPIHYEALRMSMRAIKQLQERLQSEFDAAHF
jgi:CBS domain-containing protein